MKLISRALKDNGHYRWRCRYKMPDGLQLKTGSGWFNFEDRAGGARGYLRVFYYVPERIQATSRILISVHGLVDRV